MGGRSSKAKPAVTTIKVVNGLKDSSPAPGASNPQPPTTQFKKFQLPSVDPSELFTNAVASDDEFDDPSKDKAAAQSDVQISQRKRQDYLPSSDSVEAASRTPDRAVAKQPNKHFNAPVMPNSPAPPSQVFCQSPDKDVFSHTRNNRNFPQHQTPTTINGDDFRSPDHREQPSRSPESQMYQSLPKQTGWNQNHAIMFDPNKYRQYNSYGKQQVGEKDSEVVHSPGQAQSTPHDSSIRHNNFDSPVIHMSVTTNVYTISNQDEFHQSDKNVGLDELDENIMEDILNENA